MCVQFEVRAKAWANKRASGHNGPIVWYWCLLTPPELRRSRPRQAATHTFVAALCFLQQLPAARNTEIYTFHGAVLGDAHLMGRWMFLLEATVVMLAWCRARYAGLFLLCIWKCFAGAVAIASKLEQCLTELWLISQPCLLFAFLALWFLWKCRGCIPSEATYLFSVWAVLLVNLASAVTILLSPRFP